MAVHKATSGMGRFWEPDKSLLKKLGVIATAVGYAGAPPGNSAPICQGREGGIRRQKTVIRQAAG